VNTGAAQPGIDAVERLVDPDELSARLGRTRAAMQARDIDALIITDPANMHYLSGYDAWSFYVHQALLLELDGDPEPFWIGRACDASGARLTIRLPEDNVLAYPEDCVESADRHAMTFVADFLRSRGCAGSAVGTEMESYYFTARSQKVLEAAWRRSVGRWGIVKQSRLGYSIGIAYPPDWGEHSTSLRPGDETMLERQMTFHLMPGLWYEHWGIENQTTFPRDRRRLRAPHRLSPRAGDQALREVTA